MGKVAVGDTLVYREGHIITKVIAVNGDEMTEKAVWWRDPDNWNNHQQQWSFNINDIVGIYADVSKESRVQNLLNKMNEISQGTT